MLAFTCCRKKKVSGLPIVTELTSLENIDLFEDVDIIQVGARNMQNFDMLWELGKCCLSANIQELLMGAEYIATGGYENIFLCEQGIRQLVKPLAQAAVAVGANGLMIEVHPDPAHALCDGAQSITPDAFDDVMTSLKPLLDPEGKTIC